jgi:phage FluMu protein Com
MDCGRCGSDLSDTADADGLWREDQDVTCPDCQTVNQIGVEDEEFDDEGHGTAYVSHWTCRHGVSGDDPCADCDVEDATVAPDGKGTP